MNWNTFWDVKTTMDDQGWYVEMCIPISSLRFQSTRSNNCHGHQFLSLGAGKK